MPLINFKNPSKDYPMKNIKKKMRNDWSQFEESKLVCQALKVLSILPVPSLDEPKDSHWCVEYGAGDGKDCSNTYGLIDQLGFSSIQIEPNKQEFAALQSRYLNNERVYTINSFVGLTPEDGLHTLLENTPCPPDFDFLSIDMDGNDIYSWQALKKYSPKLVLIEFNPSFPNDVEWRQPRDPNLQLGCSLLATVNTGEELGYKLIGVTQINALFVRKEFYPLFGMEDNSISRLYNNKKYITTLAQLYDGTLVLLGNRNLMWHRIEIDEDAIQIIPKDLRSYYASTIVRKVVNKRVMTNGQEDMDYSTIPWLKPESEL